MRFRGVLGMVVVGCAVGVVPAVAQAETSGGAAVPTAVAAPTTTGDTTTPALVSDTATVTLTRSQTKSVQRRIGVKADGAFGAQSRSALKRYQARKKLAKTGKPNLQTLRAMKLTFAETIAQSLAAAPAPSTTSAAPAASGVVAAALAAARAQLGTAYVSGGDEPGGFDCSGLTSYAYAQAGVKLPRTSFDQYETGTPIERADIQPGDLVFFDTAGPGASHVGIAISATKAISATSHGVRIHEIFDDYWGAAYLGARRVA